MQLLVRANDEITFFAKKWRPFKNSSTPNFQKIVLVRGFVPKPIHYHAIFK